MGRLFKFKFSGLFHCPPIAHDAEIKNAGNFRIAGEELGRREDPTQITILKHPT
jgi:hypothetical protein